MAGVAQPRPQRRRSARLRRLAELLDERRDVLTDLDILDGGLIRSYSAFAVQFGIATS
jgi:acyl-CoA reductase-like NAD-dependent aldehyde dehydrogenase